MASSKFGARIMPLLAVGGLALGGLLMSGCYAATPHVAELTSAPNARVDCAHTVASVIESSGLMQLPSPPHWSMFFGARMSGPYTSFLRTGTGIGVNVSQPDGTAGACHVTIEALSPDSTCSEMHGSLSCQDNTNGVVLADPIMGPLVAGRPQMLNNGPQPPCPVVPSLACEMTYAPGADNDATVDELAKRVQAALGPGVRVN